MFFWHLDIHGWDYSIFKKLLSIAAPDEFSDDEFGLLEFFVVRLYSKIFKTKEANEARHSFFHGCSDPPTKNIPPAKEALRQHVLRLDLQYSKCQQSLVWVTVFEMLANGVGKNKKTNWYWYELAC